MNIVHIMTCEVQLSFRLVKVKSYWFESELYNISSYQKDTNLIVNQILSSV